MKVPSQPILLTCNILLHVLATRAISARGVLTTEEDLAFWNRFLQNEAELSVTATPTLPFPSTVPTLSPVVVPSVSPSDYPSDYPINSPSSSPSVFPSAFPSPYPSSTSPTTTSPTTASPTTTVPTPTQTTTPTATASANLSQYPSTISTDLPISEISDYPSAVLTEVPTSVGSDYPSLLSTTLPTFVGSDTPSTSGQQCSLRVSLGCQLNDGSDCLAAERPEVSCSDGTSIDVISFVLTGAACNPTGNNQGNATFCSDGGDIGDEAITLDCFSEDGTQILAVQPRRGSVGSVFTVRNPSGVSLPRKIDCTVVSDSGDSLQQNIIDTSGDVSLALGDEFGALQVSSCDDHQCIENICYEVDISNTGRENANITRVDFIQNSVTDSFLSELGTNILSPNQSEAFEVCIDVNLCTEDEVNAEVVVEAFPPRGPMCDDSANYTFSLISPSEECIVNVTIDCQASDGSICEDVELPDSICAKGSSLDFLTFTLTGAACDPNRNNQGNASFCSDTGEFDAEPVTIICLSDDGTETMVVEPGTVFLNGSFIVRSPGSESLPEKIDCTIVSSDDIGLQQIVLDTSGLVSLELGDEFGAFQLISCDGQSCISSLCYSIDISNIGQTDMNVTNIDFTVNNAMYNIISELQTNLISPNTSETIEVCGYINICFEEMISAGVTVEARPPGGEVCQDSDNLAFTISSPETPVSPPVMPPATSPPEVSECVIDVEVDCTLSTGIHIGKSCDFPDAGTQACLERPTEITMLFNGGNCDQSDNNQFTLFTCEDVNGGPATSGSMFIVATDTKNKGITYFEGSVSVGDKYTLQDDGERLEADMIIFVYGSANTSEANLLQRVQFETSCSVSLEINDRFGASQISAFSNTLQGNVTGFETATFNFEISVPANFTGDSATINTLTAQTNFAGSVNLTSRVVGQTVAPGGGLLVSVNGTIDLTTRRSYTILTTTTATSNPSGTTCEGTDFTSFLAGSPNPPGFPSFMPTPAPSSTQAPTLDAGTAACSIEAEIVCDVLRFNQSIGECTNIIVDPATITCANGNYPVALTFLYRGTTPSQIFVAVDDTEGTVSTFIVSTNDIFTAPGLFRESATITVSVLEDDQAGEILEATDLDTSCDDPEALMLGKKLGYLELVGFVNSFGSYTSVYPIRMTYIVTNGPYVSDLRTTYINSAFRIDGPFNALITNVTAIANERVIVYREQAIIDANEKYRNGITYNFGMNATAASLASGIGCSAEALVLI